MFGVGVGVAKRSGTEGSAGHPPSSDPPSFLHHI